MNYSSIIGAIGVTILLMAYFLNLFRFLPQESRLYIFLNLIGAALSCYASILIRYWPFIILEGCWALVSLAGLAGKKQSAAK